MKLEEIGFYTLSDGRAISASDKSPLQRVEIILTEKCNFKCPYCRKLEQAYTEQLSLDKLKNTIDILADQDLQNIRFSGGEPTLYPDLDKLVAYTASKKIKHIAISTNGSNKFELYKKLVDAGVNDFSISLDACCSSFTDKMSGIKGAFQTITSNIEKLSKLTYVTVGIVIVPETLSTIVDVITLADSLGVADIRIITAAQNTDIVLQLQNLDPKILDRHPILRYRIQNMKDSIPLRGITDKDSNKCFICLDDIAINGNYHFPCIIYMREHGKPIGKVSSNMRQERHEWFKEHDTYKDPICKANCLDCIVKYNKFAKENNCFYKANI